MAKPTEDGTEDRDYSREYPAELPQMNRGNDFLDVVSIANAAIRLGVRPKTLYRAIQNERLKAYSAPNMSSKQLETVVLLTDLNEFANTLKPDKRRKPGLPES